MSKYLRSIVDGLYTEQEENCIEYWQDMELEDIEGTSLAPTADFARRLLSVAAQSADNERLFKRIGFHKSERRNILANQRVMNGVFVQKYIKDRQELASQVPQTRIQQIVSSKELPMISGKNKETIRQIQVGYFIVYFFIVYFL